jgi:pimeloyl-ACP methyl ester carboxylesterase
VHWSATCAWGALRWGWSGGGQFALAVAAGLPERVTAVALAGTPAPAHDDLGDWPPEGISRLVGLVRKDPKAVAPSTMISG